MKNGVRLKPWVYPVHIGEKVFLLTENRPPFDGKLNAVLVPLLDGAQSEDEIVDRLSGQFELAEIYYHLNRLRKLGLVECASHDVRGPSEILHERLGGKSSDAHRSFRLNIIAVGGLDARPIAERLSREALFQVEIREEKEAALTEGLGVVLTPSYLEPDLLAFNGKAHHAGWRWLPVKPEGIEPWFGPLMTPGASGCLECILHRLRGRRRWEMHFVQETGRPPRLSQGWNPASLDILCGFVRLELEKYLTGSPHTFIDKGVTSIDLQTMEVKRHRLVKRPRCKVCGEPFENRLTALPQAEFKLSSRGKAEFNDGGHRIKTAPETLAGLEAHVGSLLGEVDELVVNRDVPAFLGTVVGARFVLTHSRATAPEALQRLCGGASTGKGRTEAQARSSALGEALERYSCQYFGDEPFIKAPYKEIEKEAIHPGDLNPFSSGQYQNRKRWNALMSTARVPEPFDESSPVDWTPAWSVTSKTWRWALSASLYYNYPEDAGGRFVFSNSNGAAAGNCREEAILQGFFELVERDGAGIWWYNRLQRPALDLESFIDAFALEAADGLSRHGYDLEILDLTTDLGVPVFCAVALHRSEGSRDPLLGLGCHFDARIALDRAISELGQSWQYKNKPFVNQLSQRIVGRNLSEEIFLRPLKAAPRRSSHSFANPASNDFRKDIDTCVNLLKASGLEMFVADMTRPETGLSVARVMAPGLAHFWPRFGNRRLYEIPMKMGWLNSLLTEKDLNPFPFYF